MKITRIFLILLALFSSSSCIKMEWKKNPDIELHKLFLKFEKAKRKQGIWLSHFGFSWAGKDHVYDGKIHVINVGYELDKGMKYDDAKKCFFTFVDELLTHVNQHEEFKDLFYHFPVRYQDLCLSFSFDHHFKGHLKKDEVYLINIYDGEVYYTIVSDFDKSNDINPYITRSSIEKLPELPPILTLRV